MTMTRLSAVAAVAATAVFATQASASGNKPKLSPAAPTPSPVEDPTSSGGGDLEAAVYLGCFHDNRGDRVMGHKLTSHNVTTEFCFDYCTELGAAFMATQWGVECWCSPDGGLDYNRHYEYVGEDAVCDMYCQGDETKTELCGGFDAFDLYKLPPAATCSTPVEPYEQCGGQGYTGSTCCPDGFACTEMGLIAECFLQCRPTSTETEPTPSPVATATEEPVRPTPTTPSPVDAPTAEPVEPTPAPVDAPTAEPVEPPTPDPVPETPAPQPVASPEPEPEPQPVGGGQYGMTFIGEGTYYGETTGGRCSFKDSVPGMYAGMKPMALNEEQYGDSLMCGACLEGTANGNGSGANPIPSTYKGYIQDFCGGGCTPDGDCGGCVGGDLDFAEVGDGRWDIEWRFVPCPGESISFEFQGSNPYYWKIQPRGTKTPVETLTINGEPAMRTMDNFFELGGGPRNGPQTVVTTTVAGVTETSEVSL